MIIKIISKLFIIYALAAGMANAQVIVSFTNGGDNDFVSSGTAATITQSFTSVNPVTFVTQNTLASTPVGTVSGSFSYPLSGGSFDITIGAVTTSFTNNGQEGWLSGGVPDVTTTNAQWGLDNSGGGGLGVNTTNYAVHREDALLFEISNLSIDSGYQLVLLGYSHNNTANRTSEVYYTSSGNPSLGTLIGTASGASATTSFSQVLANGDSFGFSSTSGNGNLYLASLTFDVVAIPEPSSFSLLIGGLAALWLLRRRLSKY
ncbi:MAG: PEP-CTERM sorting domain-containing protein [Verrucomicrobiota bacterium]